MIVDNPWSDRKQHTIGISLILVIVLVLGIRSQATVNAVLGESGVSVTDRAPKLTSATSEPCGRSTTT